MTRDSGYLHLEECKARAVAIIRPATVKEVGRCLRAGLLESPLMPLDETVSIIGTLDEVRDQIGLTYASEQSLA